MESDDIKYVINSVVSALNLDKLDSIDKEEILTQFEDEEDYEGEEPEMGGEEVAPESEDSDLGEENDLSMDALEELINTPFEDMDEEDETFDDYGMESMSNDDEDGFGDFDFNFEINEEDPIGDSEPEQDEIKELDINELTDVINQSVKEALGKYIK